MRPITEISEHSLSGCSSSGCSARWWTWRRASCYYCTDRSDDACLLVDRQGHGGCRAVARVLWMILNDWRHYLSGRVL